MYTSNPKTKINYLLSDLIMTALSYYFLSFFYQYDFYLSRFFPFFLTIFIIFSNLVFDNYSLIPERGFLKEFKASLGYGYRSITIFSFILIIGKFRFLEDISNISYYFLVSLFIINVIFVYLGRVVIKLSNKKQKVSSKKVILMTNFNNDQHIEEILKENHYEIIAYLSKKKTKLDVPVLNSMDAIRKFLANNQVDEIFVNSDSRIDYAEDTKYFHLIGIPVSVAISNYDDKYIGDSIVKNYGGITFLTSAIHIVKYRQLVIKRIIDIIIGIIGLVITSLTAIVIYPIVNRQSPGPLIFKQKRVGKNGKIFEIYKFRSMYLDAEERKKELLEKNDLNTNLMFKMKNDPRIFPFGQKLRDWSIDELPQFINVLKGEMSVVGTRPPTLQEYQNYELHHFKRLTAKPGITGLWQVSGRSDIKNFDDVVALDMKYIKSWSLGLDIKIILKTILVVLGKKGSR